MREEIWTEKIFKDDAGYFLRITKSRASPLKVGIAVMKQCRSCGCMNGTVEFVTLGVS